MDNAYLRSVHSELVALVDDVERGLMGECKLGAHTTIRCWMTLRGHEYPIHLSQTLLN